MKNKNIVFIAKSLDGFIAGKNGEIDWLHSISNPENDDMGFVSLMDEIDAVIMGRATYDVVCAFGGEWPYTKHVFVLSNYLKEIPVKWKNKITLMNGSPQHILDKIHSQNFHTLYIDGGTTIQSFLKEDLIDEMRITTIPVLLGGGFSLFGELPKRLHFEHIDSKVFVGQVVQDSYRRKRKV